MPNNPIRFRRGYSAALSGERRMKRRNVASTIAVQNKARSYAGQELGSPNGGPALVRSGFAEDVSSLPGGANIN